MARMSIDDMLGRDPRITVLASLLGWSRRETAGCLILEVWPICYDQRTHMISERIIDAAAGHVGFAKAMVESELASVDRSGKIVIRGAKERIEYLDHKRRSGQQGGVKSGESRRNNSSKREASASPMLKQEGSTPQARGNPSSSASASVPPSASSPSSAPASDPPPALVLIPEGAPGGAPGRKDAIAAFHQAFKKASGGKKPTWDKTRLGMMDGLLAKHSAAEVISRVEVLFTAPPQFLSGSVPDMGTLVQHFDKLAAPAKSQQARKSPTQIALEELERIQREEDS